MLLADVLRAGLLKSPSMRRWLANGAIPKVPFSVAYRHDLSEHDVAVCRVYELVMDLCRNSDLAASLAHQASQHIRAGIFNPVKFWTDEITVIIDLPEVLAGVHKGFSD